ncbi:hypothetical protein AGMMS50276_32980 [Synergistales bacterium]|nr:hypothetical protein AGMMS50276_32980 [Synergistales bacterium]
MRISTENLSSEIYLMPFNATAVLAYHFLKNKGIFVTSFCDNNKALRGNRYDGCEILDPTEAFGKNLKGVIILCESLHYDAIAKQCVEIGFKKVLYLEQILPYDGAALLSG